jgi:nitroreductase
MKIHTQQIMESLQWRYATRKFDPSKKLSDDQWNTCTESLRLSASSFGLQPWHFICVTNPRTKEDLRALSWNQNQVLDCSHFVVLCARKRFPLEFIDTYIESVAQTRNQDINSLAGLKKSITSFFKTKSNEEMLNWSKNQVYLALGQLLMSTAAIGIDACPMEGIDITKYNKYFNLDDSEFTSCVACAIGFRDNSDPLSLLKKVRYSKNEIFKFIK